MDFDFSELETQRELFEKLRTKTWQEGDYEVISPFAILAYCNWFLAENASPQARFYVGVKNFCSPHRDYALFGEADTAQEAIFLGLSNATRCQKTSLRELLDWTVFELLKSSVSRDFFHIDDPAYPIAPFWQCIDEKLPRVKENFQTNAARERIVSARIVLHRDGDGVSRAYLVEY